MTPSEPQPALICLDWGTSSLRAYLLDGAGEVLAQQQRPWGIMNLPEPLEHVPPAQIPPPAQANDARFEHALQDTCGPWIQAHPHVPLLACGMVGSAQGWREAPYLASPTTLGGLAQSLGVVTRHHGMPLHIVPGLLQSGGLPNVMRGEETQVLGVLATRANGAEQPLLIGLPGTHSKWVHAQGQQIHHFLTFMTGEVFAALKGHTLLGKTMQPAQTPDDDAFRKGLQVVRSGAHPAGLLSHLFSTRTLGLTGQLPPTAQADYLSGLLIGHEMAGLALHLQASTQQRPQVVLCGEPDLCRRYSIALQCWDLGTPTLAASATVQGLWRIALQAGLVNGLVDGHAKPAPLTEGTFQ